MTEEETKTPRTGAVTRLRQGIKSSLRYLAGSGLDKHLLKTLEDELLRRGGSAPAGEVLRQLRQLASVAQLRTLASLLEVEPCAVAIVGPVNVGKSTLLNALAGRRLAKVSALPGTTVVPERHEALGFALIDTPGGDEVAGEERRALALGAVEEAGLAIFLFDATRGVTTSDKAVFDQVVDRLGARVSGAARGWSNLTGLVSRRQLVVGVNKLDAVPRGERDGVIGRVARDSGLGADDLLGLSARRRWGLDELARRLIDGAPTMAEALAQAMPAYADLLARQLILRYAATAATIALTPIPFSHVVPLTALQLALVIRLARIYGHELSWRRSREMVPALAAGVGWRELSRQVIKLVPVAGLALNGGIAFAGTYATGRAAQHLLRTGTRPTGEQLEQWHQEGEKQRGERGIVD